MPPLSKASNIVQNIFLCTTLLALLNYGIRFLSQPSVEENRRTHRKDSVTPQRFSHTPILLRMPTNPVRLCPSLVS